MDVYLVYTLLAFYAYLAMCAVYRDEEYEWYKKAFAALLWPSIIFALLIILGDKIDIEMRALKEGKER